MSNVIKPRRRMRHLRMALPIIVTALGRKYGCEVVFTQNEAATNGKQVFLPSFDSDDPHVLELFCGVTFHEAGGHIAHTDFDVVAKVDKEREPVRFHIFNSIEDVRCEAKGFQRWPGARYDVDKVLARFIERGEMSAATKEDHPATVLTGYILHSQRSRVLAQDILAPLAEQDETVLREVFPKGMVTRLNAMLADVPSLVTTQDALDLTDDIITMLKEEEEKERNPPPPPQSQPSQQGQQGQQGQDQQKDQSSDGSSGGNPQDQSSDGSSGGQQGQDQKDQSNGGSNGGQDQSTPDAGSSGDQGQGKSDAQPSAGDNGSNGTDGADGSQGQDPSGQTGDGQGSQDQSGQQGKDGSSSQKDSGGDQAGADGQSGQNGQGQGSDQGQTSDGKDQGASQGQAGNGKDQGSSQGQASDGKDQGSGQTSQGDPTDQGGQGNGAGSGGGQADAIAKALGAKGTDIKVKDVFEAAKRELSAAARAPNATHLPTIPKGITPTGNSRLGQDRLSRVKATSGGVRAQLQGLVQASQDQPTGAQRRGTRLDGQRLTRALFGETRIFDRHVERVQPNAAIHLLGDCSGSMKRVVATPSSPINGEEAAPARTYLDIALEASMALALALEGIRGCNPAVSAFPGPAAHGGGNPVRVYELLRHGQKVRQAADKFVLQASGGTPMAEGMMYAIVELLQQREEKKILMVVTDGQPEKPERVQNLVARCLASGITVIGIGIGTEAAGVSQLFPISTVINDIKDLRGALFGIVRKELIAA